jgi:acyl-CoA synthetase (AMP-forming)/AMP-acid ligase II
MSTPQHTPSVEQNLYTYLLHHAREAAPALITESGITRYGELIAQAESIAARLEQLGVLPGDRVGLVGKNSPFWVASYLAILKIGAVAAPIPARLTKENFQATLTTFGCKVICLEAMQARKVLPVLPANCAVIVEQIAPEMPKDARLVTPLPNASAATHPIAAREDLAALMFTSGSTGTPNAVKVSHRNIAANTDSILAYLHLTETDRILAILPFEYCFGTSLLHTHLRVGASLVLLNSFLFPEEILNTLEREMCTGFAGVPSVYQQLLRKTTLPARRFPHWRYAQQAGGRLGNPFIREFLTAQPDVRLFVMYGQTEATARLSFLPPERLTDKLGSIGCGLEGVTLKVLNPAGEIVQPGEAGEVVAEGENVALGYWTPDPTKTPFHEGRLYTGDIGRVDAEGFIFLVDRESDFIKPYGHRISSREIEDVIAHLTDILEVAVVGMAHPDIGEAARAFVVKKPDSPLTEKDILDFCKPRLASYAVPHEIQFLSALPKNDAHKVLKKELKARP